jgi:Zn-dependent protease
MNASLRIAKIFGIPVQVHWSFALLLVWILYTGYKEGMGLTDTFYLGLFVLALFGCVILHEFGHALTARQYGVGTRDITISPIGGIARLDRMPEKPYQEFMVAIAGPLVNVAIAVALSGFYVVKSGAGQEEIQNLIYGVLIRDSNFFPEATSPFDFFMLGMIALNGILAVFNMLPAFPMDGGRVLRALLTIRLGRSVATRVATIVGQVIAVGLAIYGISNGSVITVLIGAFVFYAAAVENRSVRTETFLSRFKVSDLVRIQFTRLFIYDSMLSAAQAFHHGYERQFLVLDAENHPAGFISETEILQAIRENRLEEPVESLFTPNIHSLSPDNNLKDVLYLFQTEGAPIIPIIENGELVGVVDHQMVEHFLRTQRKLRKF